MKVSRKCFASNDFDLKDGTTHSILSNEKCFWISLHDDIALLIRASLPYFLVFAISFTNPFEEQGISYLWKSEEKVNQWLKIDARSKLIDLLIKRQFSIIISMNKNFMLVEKRAWMRISLFKSNNSEGFLL